MKFTVTKEGKATILTLDSKKLDSTLTSELKAEFLVLCKPKVTQKLVVDMSKVDFCDSSGLSALLIADRAMREHGGSVHLVGVHKKILDLMKISHLDRVFTINAKMAEALSA